MPYQVDMGNPLDIAMRLLKRELHPGENRYKHHYKMPSSGDVHPEWYNWIQETLDDPAEYEGVADDFTQPDIDHLAGATSREDFFERLYDLHNFQVDDARPPFDDIESSYRDFTDVPFNEETGFTRSEPMDIALRLLKGERKLEYGVYEHPDPKAMGIAGPVGDSRWAIGPTPRGIGLDADLASRRIKDNRLVIDPDFSEETTRRFAEKQVPLMAHEVGHALDSQWGGGSFAQQEMPAHVLEMATREAMKLREGEYPQEPIIPKARNVLLDRLYPGGRVIREGAPPYTIQTPEDNPDYQYDVTDDTITSGEPMDIALRLLKYESRGQLANLDLFEFLLQEHDHMHYSEMTDRQKAIIDAKMSLPVHLFSEGSEMAENMNRHLFSRSMHESIPDHHYEEELEYLNHYKDAMESNDYTQAKTIEIMDNGEDDHPEHPHAMALSQMPPSFADRQSTVGKLYGPDDPPIHDFSADFQDINTGEPMDIAMQLLKGAFPLSSPSMVGHTEEYEKFFNENILPKAEDEEHAKRLKLAFNHMQNFYLPNSFIDNPGSVYQDRFTGEDKERRGRYRNLGRAGYKYWSDANKKGRSLSTNRGEVHPREYLEENDLAEQEEIKDLLNQSKRAPYGTFRYEPTRRQGEFLAKPMDRHIENEKPLTPKMQDNLLDASVRGQLSSDNRLSELEHVRQFMDLPLMQSVTPKSPLQSELVYGELNENPLFSAGEPMDIAMRLLKMPPQMVLDENQYNQLGSSMRAGNLNQLLVPDPAINLDPVNEMDFRDEGPMGGKSKRPYLDMTVDRPLHPQTLANVRDAGFTALPSKVDDDKRRYMMKPTWAPHKEGESERDLYYGYGGPIVPKPDYVEPSEEELSLMFGRTKPPVQPPIVEKPKPRVPKVKRSAAPKPIVTEPVIPKSVIPKPQRPALTEEQRIAAWRNAIKTEREEKAKKRTARLEEGRKRRSRTWRKGEPMDIAMQLLKMPQEARDYATQIHEGQMYGEQPYMTHVEDVASGFDDPHLQRIAYLHDIVEDSETGIGEIHERFGEDVGHAVDALTRRQGEQYFDYINRVKEHPEGTQVKLADLHSNLKNNPNESLARRYQKAIGILTNKSEPMDIAMRLLKMQ